MFDCYGNIVGLADKDCVCTAQDRPADYDKSDSGLYVSELADVSRLLGLEGCDASVWSEIKRAIDSSVKQFVVDTNALLAKRFAIKREPLTDQVIGQIKNKSVYSPDKNYARITLNCAPVRGGVFKINSLGTIFTQTGAISVSLYNNVEGLLETFTLGTQANKHTPTVIGKTYPLYSKYADPLEYYLIYQFDENNLPRDTKIDCGCGTVSPSFNRGNPVYSEIGRYKKSPWANFMMVGGDTINSLSEINDLEETEPKPANKMYGITLDLDFNCKISEVLCNGQLDFIGNPLAMSMALAIQHLAGAKLAEAVLNSSKLDFENLIAHDRWEDNLEVWRNVYIENVNYIVSNANHTANDCFTCKSVSGLTRKGLFA